RAVVLYYLLSRFPASLYEPHALSFLSSPPGTPPVLPFPPTRRSSDLDDRHHDHDLEERDPPLRSMLAHETKHSRHCRARARIQRSEEHTSELQSPDHLVCRLLLEKKK